LSTIPRVIYKFTALEKLDLSFNFVEDVDPSLCFLTRLQHLILSNNTIHSYGLGCSIKNLVNLRVLDLSHNKLSFLLPKPPQPWEFFACLTALTRLELGGNSLRELPWEWGSIQSLSELSISLKSSTLPEVLAAWNERGIQGIVETYAAKTAHWLALQYSGKIVNDTSILQSAIQCKTPGESLAMDETEPSVHKQSLVSLVRVLEESEFANQSALLEYQYLLSSTSEWHIPGLFLSLSQVKARSDPDPTDAISKKMSANRLLSTPICETKARSQNADSLSKPNFYASGLSASRKDAHCGIFMDPFSQIPSVGRSEDISRHASFLQESGKIWGMHVPSKPNLDEVLEAIQSIDSIGHNVLFGDGQGPS
jgi:Leucine-rich repeat (LRR) protein